MSKITSNNLKKLREMSDETQNDFYESLANTLMSMTDNEYKVDTLIAYEQGKRNLPVDIAINISKIYKVSLDWIYCQQSVMNQEDTITQTLIELRKVFKITQKHTHNGWDTVLLMDYRFRNFIASMNVLVNDYSINPRIEDKMYLENLKDVYNEHKETLVEIFGATSFNEEKALNINEIQNMDGFVLDNNFFALLGLEDMEKK